MPPSFVDFFFHHIFLPPKLPSGDYELTPSSNSCLIRFVIDVLSAFVGETDPRYHGAIKTAATMLGNMLTARDEEGGLDEDKVRHILKSMRLPGSTTAFHIEAQNAGVIIRCDETSAIFETCELSPTNESIYQAKGRLIRHFPAMAVGIPLATFGSNEFKQVLTKTLVKMSYEEVKESIPQTTKADQYHDEERDTIHPRIVTELFTSFLLAIGYQVTTPGISKNSREEVVWNESKLPWRRSPVWLLMRCSLQLTMDRMVAEPEELYKSFMVYLLSKALRLATEQRVESDLLNSMSTKISRRLLKLRHPSAGTWLNTVHENVKSASSLLSERWELIRSKAEPRFGLEVLSTLRMTEDVHIDIQGLDDFVSSLSRREVADGPSDFCPTSDIKSYEGDFPLLPPALGDIEEGSRPLVLGLVELWVAAHLNDWLRNRIGDESACVILCELMQTYHAMAENEYQGRPEATSRMILVTLELWIAADKAIIHMIPLLKEYEHGVPLEVLQALLLGSRFDMERLHRAETYLRIRGNNAKGSSRPSIFVSYGQARSFPVEYFSQSSSHQNLLEKINARASCERQSKLEELQRLKAEHKSLLVQYEQGTCNFVQRKSKKGAWHSAHDTHCHRCAFKRAAEELSIEVHEWPLSSDLLKAQATVFELALPSNFGAWRDATLYLVDDVLQSQPCSENQAAASYPLRDYAGLSDFFQSDFGLRVHLLSVTKPHVRSHYRSKRVATSSEADVCVNNGLQFRYFDGSRQIFLARFSSTTDLYDLCSFKLDPQSASLQKYLVRTHEQPAGEDPNILIASQSQSPRHMSLGEFRALASLPFGYRIQWMSALTQLAMPEVDFNKNETAIFFLQLALQAGPHDTATVERCAHVRLSDADFGRAMLDCLQQRISCIKGNWESSTSLWIFTFMASRLLSMTSARLQGQILHFLMQCGEMAYEWLHTLRSRTHETAGDGVEEPRDEFSRLALRMSLICADSFNLDDEFLTVFLSIPRHAAMLLETSVYIHDHATLFRKDKHKLESIMYDRWMFTLLRARPVIEREILQNGNSCLDLAITRCWPAFDRQSDWSLVPSTCDWFETQTGHQKVHFNILSGELLVDGSPLSRLPAQYQAHHDFQKIFGSSILDVMPTAREGMTFCVCNTLEGYTVHLGMEDYEFQEEQRGDLLMRLEADGCPTMDLVPSRLLDQSLPHAFVHDFTHWYNHTTRGIELWPMGGSWKSSANNWALGRRGDHWKLSRHKGISLLAPQSRSAAFIASIFSPLDTVLSLHMLLDEKSGALEIRVPRLQLKFYMKGGEPTIRSRQFRGMQIDADQSVGTLIGFESKLVIKDSQREDVRMVIIPEGDISFSRDSSSCHVTATVNYGSARRVQRYSIDGQLGRLVDNATVESKLFLAYLHALTSHCLPDPFLRRTGTEEALSILQSASIRSIDHLSPKSVKMLLNIASLTPGVSFYPRHLRTMLKVDWSPQLSFAAQDPRYYTIVKKILNRVTNMKFLYQSDAAHTEGRVGPKHADDWLVERQILQNSRHQVSSFGAEAFTASHDKVYTPRDQQPLSPQFSLSRETAFMVYNGLETIERPIDSNSLTKLLYEKLSQADGTPAPRELLSLEQMEYGVEWLESPDALLRTYWCRLHYAFQTSMKWMNRFQLTMWLATLAYSTDCNAQVLQALRLLSLSTHVSSSPLPKYPLYHLMQGTVMQRGLIQKLVGNTRSDFHGECPEMSMSACQNESTKDTNRRRRVAFFTTREKLVKLFVNDLVKQWPCHTPREPGPGAYALYFSTSRAMTDVTAIWTIWRENEEFRGYLREMVRRLKQIKRGPEYDLGTLNISYRDIAIRSRGFVSIDDVFSMTSPQLIKEQEEEKKTSLELGSLVKMSSADDETSDKLEELLDHLESQSNMGFERRHLVQLRYSLSDLRGRKAMLLKCSNESERAKLFERRLELCRMRAQEAYNSLLEAVQPPSAPSYQGQLETIACIVSVAGFWPRLCPTFFLQQLGRHRWSSLSESWKKAIVAYGLSITALQQAQRLVQLKDNETDLLQEIENSGHQTWDPFQYPEWLLLECESGIMIRDVQHQIAEQMIAPKSEGNVVMQLNMGEGKTSVIVPIAAIALGNFSQVVRVVVAKPQAKQMHQILVSKLSGLLDRPVFRMPFSRAVCMDADRASLVRELAFRCMSEGGVMMVQPEHLLSFQLIGLECQINGNDAVARPLLEVQRVFDESSRDIVDESDENFSAKFELIYTIGLQRPIEHTPDRWVVIQEVLERFKAVCLECKEWLSASMDIDDRHPTRFPRIRIIRADAERVALSILAESLCLTGMTGFPIGRQGQQMRDAIRLYITKPDLTPEEVAAVETSAFWEETTVNHILVLRGLFAGGILAFAFGQKRWRVDYGIDPNREAKTLLAVPFRAKDNPTPRSEFSHPDVVILLTCLSYYYSGLGDAELFETLDLVIRSDNAALEYDAWVKTAPQLPSQFRQLTGINVRNRAQCIQDIFPKLRFSKGAIDYFLSHIVFAKELREFPHKLSVSGWDLGKKKANPTTGFSGTNDSRYVLPLDVRQLDLAEQNHTNALVLSYLLRPENGIRRMSQEMKGATLESESLLEMVSEIGPNARVILDVGAQIIDLDNLQFSKRWLNSRLDKDQVQAVVFFSDADELTVVDRWGKIEPLQISPFATQLDQCLVFLDEAHTRGTDLRLPASYQAAVTLGANLTKDKLVQACMRMRKLGQGQSVVFCIPREIEQKIMMMQQGSSSSAPNTITVRDVLCWAISETWQEMRRTVPLWLTQGIRFYEQEALWSQRPQESDSLDEKTAWAKRFLEDEAQSLDFRYRPRAAAQPSQLVERVTDPEVREELQHRCEEFSLRDLVGSSLQEEQERELSPEREMEREVEPIPNVEPHQHKIHADVVRFVDRGEFATESGAFQPAFRALKKTTAAKHFDVYSFPSSIWVTDDFSRTVKTNDSLDETGTDWFQRPVHWILTTRDMYNVVNRLVIISPWEAHSLLGRIEKHGKVTLHVYAPRISLGFEALDDLTLYTVPWREQKPLVPHEMKVELNIFAGQLYLSSFPEYKQVCEKLGLAWKTVGDGVALGPDGFIPPGVEEGEVVNRSGLVKSPVQFLKVLMTKIRRNCDGIEKTHMGKVLDGVLLTEGDFEEALDVMDEGH